MMIGGGAQSTGRDIQDLNARYNPGGRYVSPAITASHAEKIITQNNYETGIIIDARTGDVIAAYKGGKSSVGFSDPIKGTDDYGKLAGNIMTHNHPSGSAVFSNADLSVSAYYGVKEVRAATKNNGTAVLTKNNQHSDMTGLAAAYSVYISSGVSVKDAQNWLRSNSSKYGCTFKIER